MIKVLVERQLKKGKDLGSLLMDLHMMAVLRKGHVSNETLINPNDNLNIAVLSTWQSVEDWNSWESSTERAKIVKKIHPLLARRTHVKIFEIMSPADYEFFVDPESWTQEHEHPHFD